MVVVGLLFSIIIIRVIIDVVSEDKQPVFGYYESSVQVIIDNELYDADSVDWDNSIHNPSNQPFVLEVSFNLEIPIDSVTQEQFDERYGIER